MPTGFFYRVLSPILLQIFKYKVRSVTVNAGESLSYIKKLQ